MSKRKSRSSPGSKWTRKLQAYFYRRRHGHMSTACPRRFRWLIAAILFVSLFVGLYFSSNFTQGRILAWFPTPQIFTTTTPLFENKYLQNPSLQTTGKISQAKANSSNPTIPSISLSWNAMNHINKNKTNSQVFKMPEKSDIIGPNNQTIKAIETVFLPTGMYTNPNFIQPWPLGSFPPNFPNVSQAEIKNPHNFKFLNSPSNLCAKGDVELLVLSPSTVTDFARRQVLRTTRKNFVEDPSHQTRQLFVLGYPSDPNKAVDIQKKINEEAATYRDIIQSDFIDVYTNLTYKSVSMLKWVIQYCPSSKYIVKSDTDVNISLDNLLNALRRQYQPGHHTFIIGRKNEKGIPIRNSKSKWHVPFKVYSPKKYPPFSFGPTYGYTTKAAFKLFEGSLKVPFFYLEDVYITGLCSREVGVPVIRDPLFEYDHPK